MTDTSTDAVKALARDHQTVGDDPSKYVMGHPHHWKTAEVLQALLSERDALRADLYEAVEALHTMCEDPEYWMPYALATIAKIKEATK